MRRVKLTMSVSSSRKHSPAVPIDEPASRSVSASIVASFAMAHVRGGVDEPPGTTALIFLPPRAPPATSSRSGMSIPAGYS